MSINDTLCIIGAGRGWGGVGGRWGEGGVTMSEISGNSVHFSGPLGPGCCLDGPGLVAGGSIIH